MALFCASVVYSTSLDTKRTRARESGPNDNNDDDELRLGSRVYLGSTRTDSARSIP